MHDSGRDTFRDSDIGRHKHYRRSLPKAEERLARFPNHHFSIHTMPRFFSPDDQRFEMPELSELVENIGYFSHAATLGRLLDEFGSYAKCKFVPDDPPKFFRYYQDELSDDFVRVDIHVIRDGIEICPKQDLNFALAADDIVEAGVLIC